MESGSGGRRDQVKHLARRQIVQLPQPCDGTLGADEFEVVIDEDRLALGVDVVHVDMVGEMHEIRDHVVLGAHFAIGLVIEIESVGA
jgi:hypothetical protein